jgi:hypothetical protein
VAVARDVVEMDLSTAAREYCHVLHFPSGWQATQPPFFFRLSDYYEFRVPGLQGTKFLVRGMQLQVDKYYTSNIYEADFSDPKGIALPATEAEWQSGTPVSVSGIISNNDIRVKDRSSDYAELEGRRFTRTGAALGGAPLSPDRSALILESWSGALGRCGGSDVPLGISPCIDFRGPHGKLFFDVYQADTGKKLITLTAKFSKILPEDDFLKTGWVTERYFIIPLDDKRERCLICEFGRSR